MKFFSVVLLFFEGLMVRQPCVAGVENRLLTPGGKNVCSKEFSYNSYYYETRTHTGYINYRTCCHHILGWCSSHCTKYRTIRSYHSESKLRVAKRTSYFCCPGWAVRDDQTGDRCLQAICQPPCVTGRCDAPKKCTCTKGFNGTWCENEINECLLKKKVCDQGCTNLWGDYACSCSRGFQKTKLADQHDRKCTDVNECEVAKKGAAKVDLCQCVFSGKHSTCKATCVNTLGSYKCKCNGGYHLVANKVCTDTDECSSGTSKCEQVCWNTHGGYKCSCNVGYYLEFNGYSCHDLNECTISKGGCDQICINTDGSYRCACRKGFVLNGYRVCEDVNECLLSRPCDNFYGICMNRWGTYECGCKLGYELQYDGKTCKDIDECHRINTCNQKCINTDGSYFCSCRSGYKLASDGKTCVDIDECKEKLSKCTHTCYNIDGSYKCQCPPGYFLGEDGYTCIGEPCRTLYTPHHGYMNCTGLFVNDRCYFGCNVGYENHGVAMKKCLLKSRWSIGEPKCLPAVCEAARPPVDGRLTLPCVEEYKSMCFIKCRNGYHMYGKPYINCDLDHGKTKWFGKSTCKEINLCNPNPCLHKGKCITISEKRFTCDCSNTGYQGKHCERGIITTPEFPHMVEGEESEEFYIRAKPDRFFTIKLTTAIKNSASFYPSDTLSLYAPREEIVFKMKPLRKGLIKIRYTLYGQDSFAFDQPRDGIVYVFPSDTKKRLSNIPDEKFMKGGCHNLIVDQCPDGGNIVLSSTCKWRTTGTYGYVSVNSRDTSLPLSMTGVNFAASEGVRQFSANGVLTVAKLTQEMLVSGTRSCPEGSCKGVAYTKADSEFILKRNSFLRSYHNSVSDFNPWWIAFNLPGGYEGFHVNDVQSTVLKGERMRDLKGGNCPNIPSDLRGTYSTLVTRSPVNIDIMGQSTTFDSTFPTCVALDLCSRHSYVSLPADKHLDLTPPVSSLEVRVKGFGFSNKNVHKEICVDLWNPTPVKEKSFCIKPRLWSRANVNFEASNAKLQFQGEIFAEPKSLDTMFIERFNMEQRAYMKGSLSGKISIQVHGKKLNLISTDQEATVAVHVGGVKEQCITDSTKGVHMSIHPSAIDIDYETSALRLYPKMEGTTIQSHIYYDLLEGHVVSIDGLPRLKLELRKAERPVKYQLRPLLAPFRRLAAKYKLELAQLKRMASVYSTARHDAYRILTKVPPKYKDLLVAVNEFKKKATFFIDALVAFRDAVLISERSHSLIGRVKSLSGIMIIELRQISKMTMKPKLSQLLELNKGLSVSYFGQVCVHSLCFSNNIVSIFDVKGNHSCTNNWQGSNLYEYTYITAVSRKVRKLGPYFIVQRNAKVEIHMSKKTNDLSISLPVTVALFNKTFNTTLKINQEKFEFHVDGISIGHGSAFDVVASSDFRLTSTWDSIDFFYEGKGSRSSSLATSLEKLTDEIITSVAKKTDKRISAAHSKLQRSKELIKQYTKNVTSLKKDFLYKDRARRIANATYLRHYTNLTRERERFHSEVRADLLRNLNKALDAKCKQKECNTTCTTILQHDICQEKVVGFVTELSCTQTQKTTRSTVEEGAKTQCALQKKNFIPIYTGTCHQGGQGGLKKSLVQTGEGIGALVGMYWGPAGSAVGAAIGAAVGMIASLFSSCDESYEVFKQVINYQVPCVRRVYNTHTKTFVVTDCFTVQHAVKKDYGEPHPCVVGNSSCIRTTDPQCMTDNNNCRIKRAALRKSILQKLNVTNDVWLNMELYELRVAILFPLMLQARDAALEAKRKYERTVAYLQQSKIELKFAQSTIDNIDWYLPLEKCFLRIYKARKAGKSFLKFHDIFFKTETPDAENILLEFFVNKVGAHPQLTEFLYVFQDQKVSIKHGLLRVLKTNLCGDMLKKYHSILSISTGNTLSYHGEYPSALTSQKTKESDYACKNSKTIFNYIQEMTEKLKNVTVNALRQKSEIASSLLHIDRVINNLRKKHFDSVVKRELKRMEDIKLRKHEELQELTIENVLLRWHQNMQLFTKSCSFKDCLSDKDCIETAIQNLYELPGMIKVERPVYAKQIHKVEALVDKIFSQPSDLSALNLLASGLRDSIRLLKGMTSFCSHVPRVRLTSQPTVVAFSGEVVELKCLSDSVLPVSYTWKHNNRTLLFESQPQLKIFIQNATTGSYVCISWNRVGRSLSNETYIALRKKPVFLNHPEDFSFLSTVATKVRPFFVCNVTSDPFPTISWYYHPFHQPKMALKLHSAKPVLQIDHPTIASNGFYYCVATNQYGSSTSRKARLDVLIGEVPQQQLSIAFNFPLSRTQVEQQKYAEKMKKDSQIERSQSLGINLEDAGSKEVKVDVHVDDNSDSNAYGMQDVDLLRRVSQSRRSLSEGIQRIVSGMVDTHGDHFASEMERTMLLGFDGKRCREGYSLHENGFTCAPCLAGFYEFAGNCIRCPIGTYQAYSAQTKCIACDATQVTAARGSMTHYECQTAVLHSMDIMVVLDSSASLSSKDFSKVRSFLSKFVNDFIGKGKDIRFGLISFNNNAEYVIKLASYGSDVSSLMHKINHIPQSRSDIRRSEKAVHLVSNVFTQNNDRSRRKVLISLISGSTTDNHGHRGFDLLRNESLSLQRLAIHTIANGIGAHVNKDELLALASMPKEDNVIKFRNGDEILTSGKRLAAVVLKDKCGFSGKDIAMAIESSSGVDERSWSNAMHFLQNFMKRFTDDKFVRFGFASYGSKILSSHFKSFTTVDEIAAAVRKLPRAKDHLNTASTLNFLYNQYVTEKFESYFNKKVIILFSMKPVKDEVLANVNKLFYYENIKFLNVVMTLDKQVVGVSDIGVEESMKSLYSLSEATELAHRVRALKTNGETNCLY